jgi:hypothetical protein
VTRFIYGGGGDGDIIRTTGLPYISAVALVYDSRTGGSQITDLLTMAGSAITQVTTDAYGQAVFYGPDAYIGVLWLDFGSGVRWGLSPKAVDLAAARAIAVQRAADNSGASHTAKALLPYNAADPLEQALATALDPLVIPRFASQSARDAAFPSPVAGDRCYRTDVDVEQVYQGGQALWRSRSLLTPLSFSTTLTNTTTETALCNLNIPANNASVGSIYRIRAFGTITAASGVSAQFTWRSRHGGAGGAGFAQSGARTAYTAGAANRGWVVETTMTCLGTGTSATWFGVQQTVEAFSAGGASAPFVNPTTILDGTATIGKDSTVQQFLVITGTWDTANAGNICICRGFIAERLA